MFFRASATIEINPAVSTETYKDTSNACERSPAKKKKKKKNKKQKQKKNKNKKNKKTVGHSLHASPERS